MLSIHMDELGDSIFVTYQIVLALELLRQYIAINANPYNT